MKKCIALCLVLCLMLSGCSMVDFEGYFNNISSLLGGGEITRFADMQYSRPDMDVFRQTLDASLEAAEQEKDLDAVIQAIYSFYDVYDGFYTAYALSNIHYSLDLTDTYWEAEYTFCAENTTSVDAALDSLYRALAKSPLRDQLEDDEYFGAGFFDYYEGDTLYDDIFQDLLNQETALQNQYYALSAQTGDTDYYSDAYFQLYGQQMAQVYLELIRLRQEMADYLGYDSYPELAYDFYYGRDYSLQQTEDYLKQVQTLLVPLYLQLEHSGYWNDAYATGTPEQAFQYVKSMSEAMGGTVLEAFQVMEEGQLYDISYSPNKFSNSFEIFLADYYLPFVFLSPSYTNYDQLCLAHEFGHFCNDYASGGSMAGIDVAEVFSQGMEYLSLCYVEDASLTKLKMADSLQVFVAQAAYASFEQQVYSLEGSSLTLENIQRLYEQTITDFGLASYGWDSRDYVLVPHFFVSPMYVVSYVVSNDAALQLYMLEQEESGKGLDCLVNSLTTQQSGIIAYTQEAGLTSPFDAGHMEQIAALLKKIWN